VDRLPVFKYRSIVTKEYHHPSGRASLSRVEKTLGMSLLSGVCRQLYVETSTLPYELNDIGFRTHNSMFNFFYAEKRPSRRQRNAITHVSVTDELPVPVVLARLPNLQRVHLVGEEKKNMYAANTKRSADEYVPPSCGWYRVVKGRKGPTLEKEQAWTRLREDWRC
jgi:hypothetical protein